MASKDSQSKQFGDSFLGKLDSQLKQPAPVFNQSLFAGAGQGTKNAWTAGTNLATHNPYDPNSDAYKTLRQGIIDDTMSSIGSQFTNSGRFGGGSYVDAASQGLGQALAGLDYGNMQNNVENQFRSQDLLTQIGAAQDANSQGALLG